MGWMGGQLYFLDSYDLVPDIEPVPKPGRAVQGKSANESEHRPLPRKFVPQEVRERFWGL
jgi:hypothetical protein